MVPGILPDLSASEALDATRIYGVAGEPPWPRPLLRTIADLAGERRAGLPHVAEALQYRLSGFGAPGEAT